MISRSPELRLLYDDRAKEEKDRFSLVKDARAVGQLIGQIELLSQLLGRPAPSERDVSCMDLGALSRLRDHLEQEFRKRQA